MYDGAALGHDAVQRFPKLQRNLEEADGLIHLIMSALAGAAREALASETPAAANDVFDFVAEALANPRASSEIENAVAISFIEARELRSSEAGCGALSAMP